MNILLYKACGNYIARMDADDIMLPDRLQVQYNYMETHYNVGVLATSAIYLGSNDLVCNYSYNDDTIISNQDFLYANPLIHSTTFIRTSIIRKYDLQYEEKFKYAEDYRLWTVCAMNHLVIVIIPFIGIKYRRTDTQATNQHSRSMKKAANKVKLSFSRWLCIQSNTSYKKPLIKKTKNMLKYSL